MQIHDLNISKKLKRKRVGRGGKKGTYSGKGMKGQKSRTGFSQRATFEGGMSSLVSRTKKVRGKGFKPKMNNQIVSLDSLDKNFKDGDIVDPKVLKEKNLIKIEKHPVKILAKGKISKKLEIKGTKVSDSAAKLIEKAGGKC